MSNLVTESDSMSKKIVLFGDIAPDVIRLSSIYDPDVDGLDPSAKGKIVPAEQSLVVDDSQAGSYSLWVVDYVDPISHKSHLVRPQLVYTGTDVPNRIVSYGNENYMMFYDIRGDKTYLQLDQKFIFYGTRPAFYRLWRTKTDGTKEIVTRRVNENGLAIGTSVPIRPIDTTMEDLKKVFWTAKTWGSLKTALQELGSRDFEFKLVFRLNSVTAISPYDGYSILNGTSNSVPFGALMTSAGNQLNFFINDGMVNRGVMYNINNYLNTSTTVVFRKYQNRVQVVVNGNVVLSEATINYSNIWQNTFVDFMSVGDFSIEEMTLTDLLINKTKWTAPYSELWISRDLTSPVVLKPDTCLAADDMVFTDGEILEMEVFEEFPDNTGTICTLQTMVLKVQARQALTIQEMDKSSVPIVDFEVDLNGTPTLPEQWVLRQYASVNTLSFTPKLVYADGTVEYVPIDDLCCFVYGKDDIRSETVGMEYNLLFKYYPAKNRTLWSQLRNRTSSGFLTCEKTIKITSNLSSILSKLAVIPKWNAVTARYELNYFAFYRDHRVPTKLSNNQVSIVANSFDGSSAKFDQQQPFTVLVLTTTPTGDTTEYRQNICLKMNSYASYTTKEPWLIGEETSSTTVFGSNATPHKRPVLKYRTDTQKYFVDSALFSSVSMFLENFYYNALPPKYDVRNNNTLMSVAPVPTHFVIKQVSNGEALSTPILITQKIQDNDGNLIDAKLYGEEFNLPGGVLSNYVNETVIMEFLQLNSGIYSSLFSVPIEVRL